MLIERVASTTERLGLNRIDSPVFGSCPVGIRFEIGTGDPFFCYRLRLLSKKYFRRALHRAYTIYQNASGTFDTLLWIIYPDGQVTEEKLFNRFYEITNLPPPQERNIEIVPLDQDGELLDEVRLYWDLQEHPANVERLFDEILRTDFKGFRELQYWVYLIDTKLDVLFNLYDDRGLDVAAASRETIAPLYSKFNDWILEYDRQRIDRTFAD